MRTRKGKQKSPENGAQTIGFPPGGRRRRLLRHHLRGVAGKRHLNVSKKYCGNNMGIEESVLIQLGGSGVVVHPVLGSDKPECRLAKAHVQNF